MKKQILLFAALTLLISCDENNDDTSTETTTITTPGEPGAPGTPGGSSSVASAVSLASNLIETDAVFTDITFTSTSTGYTVANKTGGKAVIYKTTNNGDSWTAKETNMTSISNLFFINDNTGFATGQAFVSNFAPDFIKTVDGGATWTPLDVPVTSDERLDALFFTDANTGYVAGQTGKIYKTTNGGTSWTTLFDSTAEIKDIFFINANNGFAVGSNGTILKTTDAGATWTAKTSGDTSFINAVKFTDATTGIAVSTSGKILKTTDSGETWTTVFTNTKVLTSIAFANGKVLISGSAADFNSSGNVMLSSTNNGVNWVSQGIPVLQGINASHFFTDTTGFISGGTGVYRISISYSSN